ncbi:LAME_0G18602g1_1 [Lachancea meyersii CBS 8951]|uniref:LAME_0G18602g1_1 n=1 Tax=Lachancea meyersii CBS 8951 TaxID=1266667 RepID=A0A1G4KBU2_9SACH|nr:LAME_0G18602g1_1 [Lachancea meyersii CBS 8951]
MDVSSLTCDYSGENDDDRVYGNLWSLLKSDQNSITSILNDKVVLSHLRDLKPSVSSKCIFKRLVILRTLNCTPLSILDKEATSSALHAAVDAIQKVGSDPYAIDVCLCTINAILAVSDGEQDLKFLLNRLDFIEEITKSRENSSSLMDLVYLASTHPWLPENDAKTWFNQLHESGILWWLRTNLDCVKKLDFLELLFESTVRSTFYSHVQTLQATSRSMGILKPLQYCSIFEFASLLPSDVSDAQSELVSSMNLRLRAQKKKSELETLKYFTRPPINPDSFWPSLFTEDHSIVGMWISPSRNMYVHALKIYMHEFVQFQRDVEGFLRTVTSRFSRQDGHLQGYSKYATSHFYLFPGEVVKTVRLKINIEELSNGNEFIAEWNNFKRQNFVLLCETGHKISSLIQSATNNQQILDVTLKLDQDFDLGAVNLVSVLNQELENNSTILKNHLDNALAHDKLWSTCDMNCILKPSEAIESLLISNVFETPNQAKDLIRETSDSQEHDEKRRRTERFECALSFKPEEGIYSRVKFIKSKPKLNFTENQIKLILRGLQIEQCVVSGDVGTGKLTTVAAILDNLFLNSRYGRLRRRTLVVCDTEETCYKLAGVLDIIPPESIVCWSENAKVTYENKKRQIKTLLSRVQEITVELNISGDYSTTVDAALILFQYFLKPMLQHFKDCNSENFEVSKFPLLDINNHANETISHRVAAISSEVSNIFEQLHKWRALYLPGDFKKALWESGDLLLVTNQQLESIVAANNFKMDIFDNLVLCNANYFRPLEIWRALSIRVQWHKLIITGNFLNSPVPYVLQQFINAELMNSPLITNFDTNPMILRTRLPQVSKVTSISGLGNAFQVIKAPGEITTNNVNWDEAEHCVLIYAYLRSIGYPADSISIIALSPYQKRAIESELRDLLQHSEFKKLSTPKCINVFYQNYSHRNKLVIISTSGIPFNAGDLSRTAKQALLILSSSTDDFFQIVTNEKYPNVKPHEHRKVVEITNPKKLKAQIKVILKSSKAGELKKGLQQ